MNIQQKSKFAFIHNSEYENEQKIIKNKFDDESELSAKKP